MFHVVGDEGAETWRSSSENAPGVSRGSGARRSRAASPRASALSASAVSRRVAPRGHDRDVAHHHRHRPRERGTRARANAEGSSGRPPPAGGYSLPRRAARRRRPRAPSASSSRPPLDPASRTATRARERARRPPTFRRSSPRASSRTRRRGFRGETSRARRFSRAPFARLRRVFSAAGEVTSSPFRSRLVPPPTTNPNGAARAVELDFSPSGGPSHPPRLPEDAAGFDFSHAAEGPPDPGSAAPAPASRFAVPPPPFFFGTPPPRASLFVGGRPRPRPSPTIAEETSTISRAGTRTVVVSGVVARASAEVQSSSPSSARLNLGLV